MKVIGRTKEGYIMEGSSHEIANLLGFSSTYDLNVAVGDEIHVSEMFRRLHSPSAQQGVLDAIARKLREAAGLTTEGLSLLQAVDPKGKTE